MPPVSKNKDLRVLPFSSICQLINILNNGAEFDAAARALHIFIKFGRFLVGETHHKYRAGMVFLQGDEQRVLVAFCLGHIQQA